MDNLADLFYKMASIYPEKTAVWCDQKEITYKQLAKLVSQYSRFFLDNGIKYGDHIGIPMNNSIESVAIILASANIGAGLVPINPTLPKSAIEIAFLCGNVKHIIARKVFLENGDKVGGVNVNGVRICIDDVYKDSLYLKDAEKLQDDRVICKNVTGDETFIITMTSGSTGVPKPINLTQRNKYKRSMTHIDLYEITKDDKVLAATPLYHSLAERLVLMPLLIGGTSILLSRFTPKMWLECVKEQKVTFTIAVSAQLAQISELLNEYSEDDIASLRSIVSSSALLNENIRSRLIKVLSCDFHEMYGTSETSTITSINFRESLEQERSVGRGLPGVDVKILRENGDQVETGEIGEIAARTELICNGYYNKSEVFNESMQDGYFKTGDMGYINEEGYLYFSGRKKEVIITGAINVYPADIENCIIELEEVQECAAFAYPDDKLGEVVAVAIVNRKGFQINKRTVQVKCARNLADFQQPHKIFFVEELPKNAMGKVVKIQLLNHVEK